MTNNLETKEMLTPTEYFKRLKEKVNTIKDEELNESFNNCSVLLEKYERTGQIDGMKKLIFLAETILKERKLVQIGLDTFVYKEDIECYIEEVDSNVIKVIELSRYERDIPDEIVEIVEKTKPLFDELYVVFTDYTGEIERKVNEERRDKDPILFGAFIDRESKVCVDRFYFLGDWVDEYCDLTIDKMVTGMKQNKNVDIVHKFNTPESISELKIKLNQMEKTSPSSKTYHESNKEKKEPFFKKVRTFFARSWK